MKEGWKTEKLNDVCIIDYGTRVVRKKDGGSIYPVYGGGGATFKMDTFNRENCLVVARFAMSEQCTRFVSGKFFLNDSGLTVSPKDTILSQNFLNWILIANNNLIYSFGKGSAQKNLDMEEFRSMKISYPTNPSEQQRIVEILDTEFEKIDVLKANAEKNLQNAKDLFQAALKKEIYSDITQPLIDLCESIIDCPHSTPIKSSTKTDYPCIRTSELGMGIIIWPSMQYVSKDEYQKRIGRLTPRYEDIVYGREGTIGNAIMIPKDYHFCLGQRTTLFRPNKSIVNPQYLLYCVISPFVYKQAMEKNTGCGVAHVNVADIKQFKIPMGRTIKEQQSIVFKLDEISNNCSALQDNYTQTIALCDDLKQALLRKAFSGEL